MNLRETVWKFRIGSILRSTSPQNGTSSPRFAILCPENARFRNPLAIFQTVSEGFFSETGLPALRLLGNSVAYSGHSKECVHPSDEDVYYQRHQSRDGCSTDDATCVFLGLRD